MNKRVFSLALILLFAWPLSAKAQQYVVLEAEGDTGGKLVQGGLVGIGDRIELATGARVVLLSAAGEIVRLHGPLSQLLEPPAKKTWVDGLKQLATILTRERNAQGISSAVRGRPETRRPDAWVVDLASSGTKCVFADRPATLWLPSSKMPRRVALEASATGEHAVLDWPPGTTTMAWPPAVPTIDGASYRVDLGRGHVRAFVLAVMPRRPPPGATALHFAARQCLGQIDPLLKHLVAGTDPG